jgi:hypothetical protein
MLLEDAALRGRLALDGVSYELLNETVYRGPVLPTSLVLCGVLTLQPGSCLVGFLTQSQRRLLRRADTL